MNDAQIFLLIGLAYTAMGLGALLSKGLYKRLLDDFVDSPALLFLTGILTLVLGFVLVVSHNVWVMGWTVIITIFGWLALVKGFMILAFPGFYGYIGSKLKMSGAFMRVYPVIVLLIGVFLLLLGFGVL
ncbi:MAG: hypothetical protein JW765_08560 [Deltaproteobacteria bacterium]|nr:hypothetical protein [Candidatus Zymogenaceae bacterium]